MALKTSLSTKVGEHQLTATAALFDVNDTAGALLAFRGWALHDVKALAFLKQPLPELNEFMEYGQPRFTHPVKEMDGGFLSRPGYYVKLAWQPPMPVRIEAIHYDNGSDPEAVNAEMEWGWRTRFDNVGLVADLGPSTQLRAQAMRGHTLMGPEEAGIIWVDTRFSSAFALITQRLAKGSVSGRIEAFETRNRGSGVTIDDNEEGMGGNGRLPPNAGPACQRPARGAAPLQSARGPAARGTVAAPGPNPASGAASPSLVTRPPLNRKLTSAD